MMTCVMLRWDAENKNMYYTGAGHEFLLVYKKAENVGLNYQMTKNL
jgi:hypothetical protein